MSKCSHALVAVGIKKSVGRMNTRIEILHGIDLTVKAGEIVAIMGPSGCGKSTLLGILSGLDIPSAGCVTLAGQDLYAMPASGRDAYRNRNIGVIFQSHNLVNELNCVENISIPVVFNKHGKIPKWRDRIDEVISLVGLDGKRKLYPNELSGGEQQRASVARALLMHPCILFADEPTGSLDQENSRKLLHIFRESVIQSGHSIVLVTHDRDVADRCDRTLMMRDGLIMEV